MYVRRCSGAVTSYGIEIGVSCNIRENRLAAPNGIEMAATCASYPLRGRRSALEAVSPNEARRLESNPRLARHIGHRIQTRPSAAHFGSIASSAPFGCDLAQQGVMG